MDRSKVVGKETESGDVRQSGDDGPDVKPGRSLL
jgi:hypothetical protein